MSEFDPDNRPPSGMSSELIERIAWQTLKPFRQSRDLTQQDISEIGKISQAAVSQIEKGLIVPSSNVADRIATSFGYDAAGHFLEMLIERTDWSKHHFLEVEPGDFMLFASAQAKKKFEEELSNDPKSIRDYLAERPRRKNTIFNDYEAERKPKRRSLMDPLAFTAKVVKPRPSRPSQQIPKYNQYATIKGPLNSDNIDGVLISTNPDTMQAPTILYNIENAYSVEMINNEMYPRYNAGDTLFVDPTLVAMPSDDVVIQLHFIDRSVAIVSQFHNVNVDEGGSFAMYEFITLSERHRGIFETLSNLVSDADKGEAPDMDILLDKFCSENAMALGMADNGRVENISKQGLKINETIQKAEVHVIVGSFHRRYGAFARHMAGWDGNIRGIKRR